MEKLNVLYTANAKYFPHMLTSICSLLKSNPKEKFVIHIIHSFSAEKQEFIKEFFSDKAEIKLYPSDLISERLEKYNIPMWRNTNISNARIFAFDIIRDVEKLLYIDSDTIIVDSISELFKVNSNKPLSCAKELVIPQHLKSMVEDYYNTGVILFDRNAWVNNNIEEKL